MIRLMIGAIVLAAGVAALGVLEFAFYNPPRGESVPGAVRQVSDPAVREVLELTITPADLKRFGGAVTIEKLADYYGVGEAIACSIRRTFEVDDLSPLKQTIGVDATVMLCLN